MPLLDHFNPPVSRTHPWGSFHASWGAAMARLLNQGVLPEGYYAVPHIDREGPMEIDVATLQQAEATEEDTDTVRWQAPAPALEVAIEMPALDAVEVQIFRDEGDPRLAAAVELVSPRNKDRPRARQAFAVKCVSYLQQGSGLVVVDTETTRRADVHAAILKLLAADVNVPTAGLFAMAYQAVARDEEQQLRLWPATLAIGESLPTLPLWIAADLSVPLDIELSYRTTCSDIRLRSEPHVNGS